MEEHLIYSPQITFMRSMYRKHTDMYVRRKTFDFENNKVIIPTNHNMSAIEKMWISNWKNINKLYFLIVSNEVDIESLDIDNITESTDDIQIVDMLKETSLQLFNKIQYANESKLFSNNFTVIPHHSLCFIPKLLDRGNKKLVYVASFKDDSIKCSIDVRYFVIRDV